jgi:hypothetical protein
MERPSTPWQQVRRGLIRLELPTCFTPQERRERKRVLAWAKSEWTRLSRESLEDARLREEMTRARLGAEGRATEGVQALKRADSKKTPSGN